MTASAASRQVSRRVQRLRLRAPDDTLAGRGVRLIEDALRTASMPDAGAGMLLFRRLTLGRFGADVAPQTLSLALERRIAALRALAIHASAVGAAQAPAVWFRDALDAHTLLALRIAEGEPAHEWFWPLVVPELQSTGGATARLRAVVHSLRARPEAPIALPLLARALAQRGHADLLRAAVGAAQAAKLLDARTMDADIATSACEARVVAMQRVVSVGRHAAKRTASTPAVDVPPRAYSPTYDEVAPSPGPGPRRPVGAIRAPALPSTAERHPIVDPAERRVTWSATESRHIAASAQQAVSSPASHARAADTAAPRRDDDAVGSSTRPPLLRGPRSAAPARAAQPELAMHAPELARTTHAQEIGTLDQPPWPDAAPTEAGGLLFLLPVLARLGYEGWLEDWPQWAPLAIDRRMLALVCARLALPPHDPAWRLCATPTLPSPERFCAPSAWDDGIAACGSA
jgi:hypothetical protein